MEVKIWLRIWSQIWIFRTRMKRFESESESESEYSLQHWLWDFAVRTKKNHKLIAIIAILTIKFANLNTQRFWLFFFCSCTSNVSSGKHSTECFWVICYLNPWYLALIFDKYYVSCARGFLKKWSCHLQLHFSQSFLHQF